MAFILTLLGALGHRAETVETVSHSVAGRMLRAEPGGMKTGLKLSNIFKL